MNYCSHCGAEVAVRIPDGDNLPRHVCDGCGRVHYSNPKLVVGCIAEWQERILLCRRAIEPRHGLWTIPAGFMENRETTEQAAARETQEEALAEVVDLVPYGLFDLPGISQVYLVYRARMRSADHGPGDESLESRLVDPASIPWDELAFPVIEEVLRHYVADRERGDYPLRTGVLVRRLG
ncbi:MAG: NUDIX hydrolase [Gammaproteobacteria bacterium]|nr:NUDIX hydrolase [Gammaproteobacteria bacterium]